MADLESRLIDKLREIEAEFDTLEQQLADPQVVQDPDRLRQVSMRRSALEPVVERYRRYCALRDEIAGHESLVAGREDAELVALAESELPGLRERSANLLEEVGAELVTADDRAVGAVIVELRAGAGGMEAALWAGDLLAMYQRYASLHRWKVEQMELSPGEAGGCRQAVVSVRGDGAWQGLGYESGVHCVKRVPATETQGRVHTSTATVAVLPEPEDVDVRVDPAEVEEHITTAQGPGGQNVNKVATAVHLVHEPTGIEVRMQESKSQQQNRTKAWQLLKARLHDRARREAESARAEQRAAMIGSGDRSERVRTYRYKESIVVDHRLGASFNLQSVLAGEMDEMIEALRAEDRARRLAEL